MQAPHGNVLQVQITAARFEPSTGSRHFISELPFQAELGVYIIILSICSPKNGTFESN
jgi:hypothetical protein